MKKEYMKRVITLGTVSLFICLMMVLFGCFPKMSIPVPEAQPVKETNAMSPDDFTELITGKTKIEAKEIMGRPPDQVMASPFGNDPTGVWSYSKIRGTIKAKGKYIYDPIISKSASGLTIWFKDEKVEKVNIKY